MPRVLARVRPEIEDDPVESVHIDQKGIVTVVGVQPGEAGLGDEPGQFLLFLPPPLH